MTHIDWVVPWDYIQGVDTFPKTVTIPAMTAGHKAVFLTAGFAIVTVSGFSRRDAYPGHGNQDVGISEYTAAGGETSVTFSLNGGGASVSGCIVGIGPGTSFVGFSNNNGGAVTNLAGDFQVKPDTPVTATAASLIFTVASVSNTATYSEENRLRSYGPFGAVLREGGNQSFSGEEFIFQCGVCDVDSADSYPRSLSAGNYRVTTEWLGTGSAFITQVLFADTSGVPTVAPGPNSIADENTLPATNNGNYFLGTNATSAQVSGYTDQVSYLPGDTVNFQVFSEDTGLAQVEIYRRGFYNDERNGARNVLGNGDGYIAITPTVQSSPSVDGTTGATVCSWTTNASWTIPADATSGLYYVVYRRTDTTAFSSGHFVVREATVTGKAVVVLPDVGSHQPYNVFGLPTDHGDRATGSWHGLDLYQDGQDGATANFAHRGYAVSFDRPYSTQATQDMTYINDSTVGQICFMEAQGYNITYISDFDLEGNPHLLEDAAQVIMSGHHEYMTDDIYDAYINAKNARVNIICLSSNTSLWRVHITGRVITCYKDSGTLDITAGFIGSGYDPTSYTGTWRDTRQLPGSVNNLDIRRENATFGQLFRVSGPTLQPAIVEQVYQSGIAFRNCATILALTTGQSYSTSTNASGYELDSRDGSIGEPTNIVDIWRHTFTALHNVANDAGSTYNGIADIDVGYTVYRDDVSEALIWCSGAWRCMWPCTSWQSGAPTGGTKDVDWQNLWLSILYDAGMHPTTLTSMRPGEDPDVTDPSIGAPGPTRTAIAIAYGLTVANQTISLNGIASTESFGSVGLTPGTISAGVSGVGSAERFGSGALTTNVQANPVGVAAAERTGNATCTSVNSISSPGASSSEAFGSQGINLSNTLSPIGQDFSSVPSSITLEAVVTTLHIDSSEAVGAPSVVNTNTVSLLGVSSDARFGTPNASTASGINPTGISSAEQPGIPTSSTTVTAFPPGCPSDSVGGIPQVSTLVTIQPTGVTSSERFGNLAVSTSTTVSPAGSSSQEAFGSQQVLPGSVTQSVLGVESSEGVGASLQASIGTAIISPVAGVSSEQVGYSSITTNISANFVGVPTSAEVGTINVTANSTVTSTGVSSGEKFGSPAVGATVGVLVQSIGSQETFGSVTVGGSVLSFPNGTSSDVAIGSPSVTQGPVTISPVGVGENPGLGTVSTTPGAVTGSVTGCASDSATGNITILAASITISPVGATGNERVGNASTQPGSLTIQLVGVDSANTFGTDSIQISTTVNPSGVSSEIFFGEVRLARVGSAVGVPSAAQTGNPTVTTQAAMIRPVSISSSVVVGNSRISLAITFVRIEANDPVLLFDAQDPILGYDADPKLLWEASL